jgi:hypothetical protein
MNMKSFMALLLLMPGMGAYAASCMVLGEQTARVQTVEGERSPVFVTADCSALRLISGQARASWIGRDGKPRIVTITKDGIAAAPQAGAEERSVIVVWNELSTKRERQQPAYMRNIGDERPPKVYIPIQDLVLFENSESNTEIVVENTEGVKVYSGRANVGESGVIPRSALANGQIFKVMLKSVESTQEWRWRIVSADEMHSADQNLALIDEQVPEPTQSKLMRAMLFEQMKIRVNMDLTLQGLR